ncbi:MAG: hypothetical protein HYV63_32280 [Candidatus Schekmanbacteria bacterium]|nr:hypothetical protein [Candidatus Schekmanbacteria bacterium]
MRPGHSADTNKICTTFGVPADYFSTGIFRVGVTQSAATTEIENISCTMGIDGTAQGGPGTTALVSQTGYQTVTVTPAGAIAAGSSIGLNCWQGNGTQDDDVNILLIEFRYTAVQ